MENIHHEEGRGVLNETTMTLHKREIAAVDLQAVCGHTHHVDPDRLQTIQIEQAIEDFDARKCGQCFEDGGGY